MLKKVGITVALTIVANIGIASAKDDHVSARNIVFVIVDDLRFDGLGFLTPEVQTPNIAQLAAERV